MAFQPSGNGRVLYPGEVCCPIEDIVFAGKHSFHFTEGIAVLCTHLISTYIEPEVLGPAVYSIGLF